MADSGGIGNAARARRLARLARLPVERLPIGGTGSDDNALVRHEWLVTNGIGGYASGTVAGVLTRRYHGLLVAALPNPLGRVVMLSALREEAEGVELWADRITAFELEGGIPTWRYDAGGASIEKRVLMPHRQNTVIVIYRAEHRDVTLRLSPSVHFRGYEAPVSEPLHDDYAFTAAPDHFQLAIKGYPPLRFALEGTHSFVLGNGSRMPVSYEVERARGYQHEGAQWSPGSFIVKLRAGESAALMASTEELETIRTTGAREFLELEMERKRRLLAAVPLAEDDEVAAKLVIAADQFIIKPVGRVRDTVRASAVGDEVRTVIAGYHWFTDWGRDTMISLEGLTLTTGRHREAGFILRTFAQYVRDGLIPNLFPDGSDEGLYHTADATLWFFHALERYAEVTGYWEMVQQALPVMRDIVNTHIAGTRFGIGVDPDDGLFRQGEDGYQLTWMDAKVEDWVVTPRRGKAVELNALWYNALCLLSGWESDVGDRSLSTRYGAEAARVRESFNRRFWYEQGGYLYDVIDTPSGKDDSALRPNQVLAISLPHPVLEEKRWAGVMGVVAETLLTPVGLRSLAPGQPDYKSRYFGDLRARDAAYHQGTVWGWLIGPWIDAWLKVHPGDREGARRFLEGLKQELPAFGIGSIAEIFDAESPFTPRGCIAQAWSVAEALRCWVKTAPEADRAP